MTDLFTHAEKTSVEAHREAVAACKTSHGTMNTRAYHKTLEGVKAKATDALRAEIERRRM